MRVILASKSPRRKELLSHITNEFEVIVSSSDEVVDENLIPIEKVKEIAKQKAEDVFNGVNGDCVVIGSDTIVVTKNGEILGKPKDREDAIRMLSVLNNDFHDVMTGVAVYVRKGENEMVTVDACVTKVHFANYSEEEMNKWLDTGNAWDKAGAYAVQQEFGVFIDKINGSYSNVVGLPVHLVYNMIKEFI